MTHLNRAILSAAGTGKSYTVKQWEKEWIKEGRKYALLAATGIASVSLGGSTVHRFFSIGIGRGDREQLLKSCRQKGGAKRIREVDIIVIDEISMISADLLDTLNYICQTVRRSVLPFGGLQVVFTGDFMQLPPVSGSFCFKSSVWKDFDFEIIMLTEPKRFTDLSYWKMLMRARMGFLKRKDVTRLNERVLAYKNGEHLKNKVKPTILYSHRADVDRINQEQLDQIDDKKWFYYAVDNTESNKTLLDSSAPACLCLKKGAQVMCTSNIDLDNGICNGSRGVILECFENSVVVQFLNGQKLDITAVDWEIEDGGRKVVRTQIPLQMAWSTTIHKCQGLTIDCVVLSLDHTIFSPGQAYVALSRTKGYSSLYLSTFTESAIKCSLEAKQFYKELSEEDI